MLFGSTFYVYSHDLAINVKLIELIRMIQKEFKDVTRDEQGRIYILKEGYGQTLKEYN